MINLWFFSSTLNIKYVLFVVSVLGSGLAVQRLCNSINHRWVYLILACLGSTLIYVSYPNIFVDDTGFVVRYMEMARKGCFYCYNETDGSVFGISSFVYGVFTSLIAMTELGTNEGIINGLNFLGLTVLFYLLLKTFLSLTKNHFYTITAVALTVMSATQFQFASTVGLETNFHLAIVFTGIYFFFSGSRKWMWFFFGMSVISKLDTVPLITILSLVHLWENRAEYLGDNWWKQWLSGFIIAGVPVLVFVATTFLLFDGPLPQSAYAKLYYHSHPSDHWFPFLELMFKHDNRAALVGFSIVIPILHLISSMVLARFKLRDFAFLLGFLGTMLLFYVYNPVERMSWYYALPELLLYSQLLISVVWIAKQFGSALKEKVVHAHYSLMFAALCISVVPMTTSEKVWTDRYMKSVEAERLEIGRFISTFSGSDTLVSAHGHFGAYYKGYVFDLSGLNSKLATDFKIKTDSVLSTFRPRYFIHHANLANIEIAAANGYVPMKEWTAIEEYGYPKWVLWKREDQIEKALSTF